MGTQLTERVESALKRFINWLSKYGETSYDHQSYFVGPIGSRAKALYYKKPLLGKLAVAPMIFSEAFLPAARKLFWKQQRLPIADAHYAMGFAFCAKIFNSNEYHDRAVHFLDVLEQTRCPGYQHHGWGYPFDWVTRGGIISMGTPLITTTPYAFEAFAKVYELNKSERCFDVMRSIADHVLLDYKDFEISPGMNSCSYTPDDQGGVINASAYRAFTLTSASLYLSDEKYWQVAEKNLEMVLQAQKPDGSWLYAIDNERDFVDHFHTCFVLKALAKIEKLKGHRGCSKAIDNGVKYYLDNLFDDDNLPKPFSKAPRLTVYKNELYDYAECINLGVLLRGRFKQLDELVDHVVQDVLTRWQRLDGSFRSRKLLLGWDNVPMHRWAQSQIFRSLSFYVDHEKGNK
ncbi:MAG: hypothetical protein GY928_25300 [Colwellia sp.]|nr:hypothetical protein [Colwellia sp.]